VKWSYF